MRNPNRIIEIIESLELLWRQNPDLRFGQLVEFIYSKVDCDNHPYYVEDDQWLSTIDSMIRKENDNG